MANLTVNSLNRYTVDSLYQWDIDQVLYIHGLNIKDPEIHFTNNDLANAIPRIPTVDDTGVISVLIPNSLLQSSSPITVYICGYEDSTYKTYFKVTIKVKARKKPGDYKLVVTDEEVYSFNALTKSVADLERAFNFNETAAYYSYIYNSTTDTLSESSRKLTIYNYIPFVSSSLKAIKSIIDKMKKTVSTYSSTITTLTKDVDALKIKNDWNIDKNVGVIGRHTSTIKITTPSYSTELVEELAKSLHMINSGTIYLRMKLATSKMYDNSEFVDIGFSISHNDTIIHTESFVESDFPDRATEVIRDINLRLNVKKGDKINLIMKHDFYHIMHVNNLEILANIETPFTYASLAESAADDFTTEDIINTLLGVE